MEAPADDGPQASALLEAARRVLRRDGVVAITLDSVAPEAGVERADVERCFGNLGVLLNELGAVVLEEVCTAVVDELSRARNGEEALDVMIRAFTAWGADHIEEFRLTHYAVQLIPEMKAALTPEVIEQRFRTGRTILDPVEAMLIRDWGDHALPSGVHPRQLVFIASLLAQSFTMLKTVQDSLGHGLLHSDEDLMKLMSSVLSSPPRAMRQLAALNSSSRELAKARTEKELFARVPELLTGALDFDRCLLLIDIDGVLQPVASAWPNEYEERLVFELIARRRDPPKHYRRCVETDETIYLANPMEDPEWAQDATAEDLEALEGLNWAAPMVITPIRCGGAPIGCVMGHAHLRWRPLDTEDISRVETFAAMVGIALENVRMLENLNAMVDERTRELRDAQAALVQSEKMASMGQLVAGVAHELNTPVGAVESARGTLHKAAEKLAGALGEDRDRRVDGLLDVITDSARVVGEGTERIDAIVTRLRSFARLDEAAVQQVDLHECIEDAIAMAGYSLPVGVVIERSFSELAPLRCDPRKLNQLFASLLSNAVDAVGDEGVIRVCTSATTGGLEVAVTDTGPGIAAEHLAKIFDPGFTTKGVGVGTGLGLSIAYRIVEEHGGTIVPESTLGEGTRMLVRLPL